MNFGHIIFSTYTRTCIWSNFIWSSGHSDENKAKRKFNQQNILPPKHSRFTAIQPSLLSTCVSASILDTALDKSLTTPSLTTTTAHQSRS